MVIQMAAEMKSTGISKETMKDAVVRTLRSKIEEINQKLIDANENMRYFEKKYGMKTEEFCEKFLAGELGDDMDFFEWKALKEIYNELNEERRMLLEAIG